MKNMKIVQANLMSTKDKKDAMERHKSFAKSSILDNADIITVQEVSFPEQFSEIMRDHGYENSVINNFTVNPDSDYTSLTGIVSRHSIDQVDAIEGENRNHIIAAKISVNEVTVNTFSVQLKWGASNISHRLKTLSYLDRVAEEMESEVNGSVTIMGGDLNSFEDGREMKFLHGRDICMDGRGTYWLDAWKICGGNQSKITVSTIDNKYARETAIRAGLSKASRIPDRRIDFIMSRGWNHGRIGDFNSFSIQEKREIFSDHWAISATMSIEDNDSPKKGM